jgi:di/tripeptidase
MKGKFQEIFEKYQSENVQVQVEVVGLRPCEHLDKDQILRRNQMVDDACQLLESITGRKPKPGSSSTDCNIPLSMGIPSTCYGTYFGDGAHTREEYVEASSLTAGYQVALASVLKYF